MLYPDGNGYGIEFRAVDRHDFRVFEALLKERAPEPDRFRQEVARGFIPALEDWAVAVSSPRAPAP
jgi:hypothetical protein